MTDCSKCGKSFRYLKTGVCQKCRNSKPKTRSCAYCGEMFTDHSKQNGAKYCSDEHGYAAKQAKKGLTVLAEIKRVCELCGDEFTPKRANQIYCKRKCGIINGWDDPEDPDEFITCKICDVKFHGRIPNQHLREHNLKNMEYSRRYGTIYSKKAREKYRSSRAAGDGWVRTEESKKKQSESLLLFYLDHKVWNKGLDKSSSISVLKASESLKKVYSDPKRNPMWGKRHTKKTIELLSTIGKALWLDSKYRDKQEDSRRAWFELGQYVSMQHAVLIEAMLQAECFDSFDHEAFVTLKNGKKQALDIASRDLKLGIQVDGCIYHNCPEHSKFDVVSDEWKEKIRAHEVADEELVDYCPEGWSILRFWEHEIVSNLPDVLKKIARTLNRSSDFTGTYTQTLENLSPYPRSLVSFSDDRVSPKVTGSVHEIREHYRSTGFPYPIFQEERFRKSYTSLQELEIDRLEISPGVLAPHNAGIEALNHFMDHIWGMSVDGRKSALEWFEDDELFDRIIQSRLKHAKSITDASVRRGFKLISRVPRNFSPSIARFLTTKYCPEKGVVFDPCAGFGGRLLGVCSSGRSYQGVEITPATVERLRRVTDFFRDLPAQIREGRGEETVPFTCDMVMTSPPFFTKERYSDHPEQSINQFPEYQDWLEGFLKRLVVNAESCLPKGGVFAIHVGNHRQYNLIQDTQNLFESRGWELEKMYSVRFKNVLRNAQRSEPVFVYRRN